MEEQAHIPVYNAAQAYLGLLSTPILIYRNEDSDGAEADVVEAQLTTRCRIRFAMGNPKDIVLLGVL